MDLKKYITEKSKELKIDIIGFAEVEEFKGLKEFLKFRRNKGYETEFEEKDIELRINPQNIMKNCKSIIAIGISYNVDKKNYFETPTKGSNKEKKGVLSKSTWGKDYHIILRERLEELAEKIKKIKDYDYKIFVDTGSLVDREVAKRAGIGWYGKNNSIINDKYGSFIFIGYMVTNLELDGDIQQEKKCGDCKMCIEACPTGALEDKHRMNSRKCISYLTQTKEKIPYSLREKMGINIYGCDICQKVCPKNKQALKSQNECFIPKLTNGHIEISELFNLSNKEFKKNYGHMAGSWRGKNVLKRNCIIAMGNIKDIDSIDLLRQGLKDESFMIREYSVWALLKINKELGKDVINKHINLEKDNELKKEMENVMKYFEGDN